MIQSRPVHILLIEDNPGDVRLTQEAFRESNLPIRLDVVMDGLEGVRYLRKQGKYENATTPDLVLLDLNLPKMDGRQVLQDIKNDPELRRIPIVVLTTSNAEHDILQCYDLHANSYVNKPVDFDQFFDIIRQIEAFWIQTSILPSMVHV